MGQVGYHAASFIQRKGGIITTIIEKDAALYHPDGLDVDEVMEYKRAHNEILNFPNATDSTVYPEEYLSNEVDCVILASVERVINKTNARKLNCKMIVEGGNGPITFLADQILRAKNIQVCPDILMSAGGIAASYFEWINGLQQITPNIYLPWRNLEKTQL